MTMDWAFESRGRAAKRQAARAAPDIFIPSFLGTEWGWSVVREFIWFPILFGVVLNDSRSRSGNEASGAQDGNIAGENEIDLRHVFGEPNVPRVETIPPCAAEEVKCEGTEVPTEKKSGRL